MHSCIFQVSSTPISEGDRVDEDRYVDRFIGSVADYVDELTGESHDHAIEWLKVCLEGAVKIEDGKLIIINRMKYLKAMYLRFLDALNSLMNNVSEDSFAGNNRDAADAIDYAHSVDFLMYQLKNAYKDECGFYMDDNDEKLGNVPLIEFMRNAKDGEVYYLGSVMDYHC